MTCENCKRLRQQLQEAREELARTLKMADNTEAGLNACKKERDEARVEAAKILGSWTHCENKLNASIAKLAEVERERDEMGAWSKNTERYLDNRRNKELLDKLRRAEAERDEALAAVQSLCDQKKAGRFPEVE